MPDPAGAGLGSSTDSRDRAGRRRPSRFGGRPEADHLQAGPRSLVLVIDDQPEQRELIMRVLGNEYDCLPADSADQARAALRAAPIELVLCDVDMPGESGIELAQDLKQHHPELAITMVTGIDDARLAKRALEDGAYGYIVKPFRATELRIGVANALRRRRLEIAARDYVDGLEGTLLKRKAELTETISQLERSRAQLEEAHLETLQRLGLAVEARDQVTADHVNSMVRTVERFARRLGYAREDASLVGLASAMHDVGKIGVPDAILLKPGPLTDEERAAMQRHPEIGHRILDGSPNRLLQVAASIAWCHHEQVDGAGYPRGLAGDQIPREAKIVQIADAFNAMTTDRPYRRAMTVEQALREIERAAGTQFDSELAGDFIRAQGQPC